MKRNVQPELLDELSPEDSQAQGSRRDLQKLNWIMGHAAIFERAFHSFLKENPVENRPLKICELGAGDGTLLLEIARRMSVRGVTADVTMIDRQSLVSNETCSAFSALQWKVETVSDDVFSFLERPKNDLENSEKSEQFDIIIANLFLHHFKPDALQNLLRLAAKKTRCFITCEPRRTRAALLASRLLGVIGCNAVTRNDAVISVRAGFANGDLSALWPTENDWQCSEHAAGLFTHFFMAKRNEKSVR